MTKRKRPGVRCPRCDGGFSKVVRVLGDGRRRRKCSGCGLGYSTFETTIGRKVLPVAESLLEAIRFTPQPDATRV